MYIIACLLIAFVATVEAQKKCPVEYFKNKTASTTTVDCATNETYCAAVITYDKGEFQKSTGKCMSKCMDDCWKAELDKEITCNVCCKDSKNCSGEIQAKLEAGKWCPMEMTKNSVEVKGKCSNDGKYCLIKVQYDKDGNFFNSTGMCVKKADEDATCKDKMAMNHTAKVNGMMEFCCDRTTPLKCLTEAGVTGSGNKMMAVQFLIASLTYISFALALN